MLFSDFPDLTVNSATNADQQSIVQLIDTCYQEYGDRVVLDGDDSDLLNIESNYRDRDGEFIAVTDSTGSIIGTHAVVPLDKARGLCTFRRLYLEKSYRGSGLGQALMLWAIQWARNAGYSRVEFWSDTRFTRAHQFFRKLGFETSLETRDMDDGIQPYSEYFFWLDFPPKAL
tara:strand:+ start:8065 stop:8583 length:519 start_codon:yes stop_codon:yes gene_type:complete